MIGLLMHVMSSGEVQVVKCVEETCYIPTSPTSAL